MDRQRDKIRIDFLQYLDADLYLHIMSFLDDPTDLIRLSSVSRFWRQFVIANGLVKQLCVKTCPQLSNMVGLGERKKDKRLFEKNHKAFAALLHALTKSKDYPGDCIAEAISASSNRYYTPYGYMTEDLYWSSRGRKNPQVPETLFYKLHAKTWLITEVHIQPFEAPSEPGKPIYSAKSVRIRIGHRAALPNSARRKVVWDYTSPEFPMMQENQLQQFRLPKPVLSIDGYLQIELLGRVQKQESDGLFYIRLRQPKVVGRPLYPAFDIKMLEPNGRLWLKYNSKHLSAVVQCDDDLSDLLHLSKHDDLIFLDKLRRLRRH